MADRFLELTREHRAFIAAQHIFFVASAARETQVNLSPKPANALRVIDAKTVAYLDQTGSGNETAAHITRGGRLTIMLCAFEGPPRILQIYGAGTTLARGTSAYDALLSAHFDRVEPPGARQMIALAIDRVQTSCGYGVPTYKYTGDRDTLDRWAVAKGETALAAYREANNTLGIDGDAIVAPGKEPPRPNKSASRSDP